MSSVGFAWIFLLFIELQISDIASNIDAYERKLQRTSYFQRKTAYQVCTFRDRAQPINPVKENKNRHWDLKFCVINLFGVWNL